MRWICWSGPGPYPTSPLFPRRHVTLPDRAAEHRKAGHGARLLVASPSPNVAKGWADFARLRRQVAAQCADAGLTGTRLDDFILAVHEIAANAIVHAGAGGRLILRRAASGLRCLVADTIPKAAVSCPAPLGTGQHDRVAVHAARVIPSVNRELTFAFRQPRVDVCRNHP
jgi:hypothetical protein